MLTYRFGYGILYPIEKLAIMREKKGGRYQVNVRKFMGKLTENDLCVESISAKLGLAASTVYRKLKNSGLNFTIGEMHKLVSILHLTKDEAIDIFLPQYSQKCE